MNDIELAKRLLPILQAKAEKKQLQFLAGDCWMNSIESILGIVRCMQDGTQYRVKPEPVEWWEIRSPSFSPHCYETLAAAREANQGLHGSIYPAILTHHFNTESAKIALCFWVITFRLVCAVRRP